MRNARVTGASQVYRLRESLIAAGVSHNADTRVTIPSVKLMEETVFFCEVYEVSLVRAEGLGDGTPLPMSARITGLPAGRGEQDYVDLVNARVVANGRIHLIVDRMTEIVPVNA